MVVGTIRGLHLEASRVNTIVRALSRCIGEGVGRRDLLVVHFPLDRGSHTCPIGDLILGCLYRERRAKLYLVELLQLRSGVYHL